MKKITSYTAFFAILFSFTGANAQNTATQSGDWNNCATWGNPASIIQNVADTKTINSGVTVTQNAAWSAGAITLNGTGAVTFASAANSVDFVTDGGADQSCTPPNCPVPSGLVASRSASSITTGNVASFSLSGSNISSATWVISPSTGVSQASGNGSSANNISFSLPGIFYITFTASSTGGSCTTTTLNALTSIAVVPPACVTPTGLYISSNPLIAANGGTVGPSTPITFTVSGTNMVSATWAIYSRTTPLTLLLQGTGFSWATTTPSLVGLAVGDCFVEVTVYGNGSCSASSRRYFNLVTN